MATKETDAAMRRTQFITAAGSLFSTKGFNETSIRDILHAVGDRSPSVFYYYFNSKEDLYRQVLDAKTKQYLAAINTVLNKAQEPMAMMRDFLQIFLRALMLDGGKDSEDPESHLFYLHLAEQVTLHYVQVWKKCIPYLTDADMDERQIEALASFLAGGTGRMILSFHASNTADFSAFCRNFVAYCGRVLCLNDKKMQEFEELVLHIVNNLHTKKENKNDHLT